MKISIITVVLNAAADLEKTINSVMTQINVVAELIVIDGGSTDDTLEVIRRYEDCISYKSSQPDRGIYDAMNKGINKSTGEWISFMNAGDVFSARDTLYKVFSSEISDFDVIYGDSIADYGSFNVYKKARLVDDIFKGMICCHQSMLFRSGIFRTVMFNTKYKISADYDLIYRLFRSGKKFLYLPDVVAVYDAHGISGRLMLNSVREQFEILKNHGNISCSHYLYQVCLIIYFSFILVLQKVLPTALYKYLVFIQKRTRIT